MPTDAPRIPEITEQGAGPGIRAIYADIKASTGMVNLIYRRLATIEGALPWAWGRLRGVYVSGEVAPLAEELRRATRRDSASLPAEALSMVGIESPAREEIVRLLASYNDANAMNLLAMTALLRAARGKSGDGAMRRREPRATVPPRHAAPNLPPLPGMAELSPAAASLAVTLNHFGEPGAPEVMASLYRHLALWPGCLALVAAYLTPLQHAGLLDHARRDAIATAERLAARLDLAAPTDEAPPAPETLSVIESFATRTIAKMVPIGQILAAAMSVSGER